MGGRTPFNAKTPRVGAHLDCGNRAEPRGDAVKGSTRKSIAQGGREKRPVSRSQAPSPAPSRGGETEQDQLPGRTSPG